MSYIMKKVIKGNQVGHVAIQLFDENGNFLRYIGLNQSSLNDDSYRYKVSHSLNNNAFVENMTLEEMTNFINNKDMNNEEDRLDMMLPGVVEVISEKTITESQFNSIIERADYFENAINEGGWSSIDYSLLGNNCADFVNSLTRSIDGGNLAEEYVKKHPNLEEFRSSISYLIAKDKAEYLGLETNNIYYGLTTDGAITDVMAAYYNTANKLIVSPSYMIRSIDESGAWYYESSVYDPLSINTFMRVMDNSEFKSDYLKIDYVDNNVVISGSPLVGIDIDIAASDALKKYQNIFRISANPDSIIVKNEVSQKEYAVINQNQLWDINEENGDVIARAVNDIAIITSTDESAKKILIDYLKVDIQTTNIDKIIIHSDNSSKEYEIINNNQLWEITEVGENINIRAVNDYAKNMSSIDAAVQFIEEFEDFNSSLNTYITSKNISIENNEVSTYNISTDLIIKKYLNSVIKEQIFIEKGAVATDSEIEAAYSRLINANSSMISESAIYNGSKYFVMNADWQDINIPVPLWDSSEQSNPDDVTGGDETTPGDTTGGDGSNSEDNTSGDDESNPDNPNDPTGDDESTPGDTTGEGGSEPDGNSSEDGNTESLSNRESTLDSFLNGMSQAIGRVSMIVDPMVVDLDNDGLEIVSQENGVFFDMDNDGFAEKTSWVSADDGQLVIDKNNNNAIDNITELFGSEEKTGFEELSLLDSNADGVINSSDDQFSEIKIWKDSNQNGISEDNELTTLEENNISSISLTETQKLEIVEDSVLLSTGTVTKNDGTILDMGEFNFSTNNSNTLYIGDDITSRNVALEALSYTQIRGYGNIKALYLAMSEDGVLLDMVKNLSSKNIDISNFDDKIDEMIYRWAEIDNVEVYENDETYNFVAKEIAFAEKYLGRSIDSIIRTDPGIVTIMYDEMHNHVKEQIILQGVLSEYAPDATYSYLTDSIDLKVDSQDFIKTIYDDLKDIPETLKFVLNGIGDDIIGNIEVGTSAKDEIRVSQQSTIIGLEGNDTLVGSNLSDTIYGGEGNDLLVGRGGEDLYIFDSNFGEDIVQAYNDSSTLKFNFNIDDIEFERGILQNSGSYNSREENADLYVKQVSTGAVVIVDSFFHSALAEDDIYGNNLKFEFIDGTILTGSQINELYGTIKGSDIIDIIYGTKYDDVIDGGEGNDVLYAGGYSRTQYDSSENTLIGGSGNDTLNGAYGNDTLIGGTGDDRLMGNKGDDTYIFEGDFGFDTIYDTLGTNNLIIDSAYDDLWFSKDGSHLNINKLGTDEKIRIEYVGNTENTFETKDGYVLDVANLDSLVTAMSQFNPTGAITETFNPNIDQATSDLIAASWYQK